MGLHEKAEKYIRDKKDALLYALKQRDFSGIFSEDERIISFLIRDLSSYTDASYAETCYLREVLKLLPVDEIVNLSYEDIEKKFASFFENIFKSEYFICYFRQGSKCIASDISKEKLKNSSLWKIEDAIENLDENISIIGANSFFGENIIEQNKELDLDKAFISYAAGGKSGLSLDICLIGKREDRMYTKYEKDFINFLCLYMSYIYNIKGVLDNSKNIQYKLRYVKDIISLIQFIENAIKEENNFCITIGRIESFKIPKKQYENYGNILKQTESVFLKLSEIDAVNLGFGFYAALYSDKNKIKDYESIFKNIKDEIKKNVLKNFSFNIQSIVYNSEKFKNKSDFIAVLTSSLVDGKNKTEPKKKNINKKNKTAVKNTTKKTQKEKTVSKKTLKKTDNTKNKHAHGKIKNKTASTNIINKTESNIASKLDKV